ncbi:MAG: hypothetical protein P0121_09805 [Nitrospira sp.]|nr:hypothetical protein [Nitrospira sp.]
MARPLRIEFSASLYHVTLWGNARRSLGMILEERPVAGAPENGLLSEVALAESWNRPEEEKACAHLSLVR